MTKWEYLCIQVEYHRTVPKPAAITSKRDTAVALLETVKSKLPKEPLEMLERLKHLETDHVVQISFRGLGKPLEFDAVEVMNMLGSDGWEMTRVAPGGHLWFKRPMTQSPNHE